MIGNKIKYLRLINKMTQEELAEKVFVNRQAVSKWEKEETVPSLETIIRISKLFNVSLDELILNENHDGKTINITNGDCFNTFINEKFDELFIPFREAMIDGNTSINLFEADFNQIRADNHHVELNSYLEHMKDFYAFLKDINTYDEITLWFGVDTFCQINLLCILAYLDKVEYKGYVYTVLIEDRSYKVLRSKELIKNDNYYKKYEKLMCKKDLVDFSDLYLNNASKEYLDLISDEGEIATLIKKNVSSFTRRELVELVWDKTRKYGLGDVQVFKIIEKYTDYKFIDRSEA